MSFLSEIELNIRTGIWFFVAFLGILFYVVWGVAYGGWFDIGVYSITIVLVGFGLIGIVLYSFLEEEEE